MARLRRRWRVLKWAGLVVSLLIIVAWVVSLFWAWGYVTPRGQRGLGLGISRGSIFRFGFSPWPQQAVGWQTRAAVAGEKMEWLPSVHNLGGSNFVRALPLWIPFILVAIPTFYLWRADRRIPPGHCQKCGYNLTGNVSGICPECGTNVTCSKTDQSPDSASHNGIN